LERVVGSVEEVGGKGIGHADGINCERQKEFVEGVDGV